ncbi:hypothetical protein, partial [Burkholderia multivorans]|uniref:hypothetical protein n=1 Tax=Burkholderia multivorans TaxID=87883 RepID=UPI001C25A815
MLDELTPPGILLEEAFVDEGRVQRRRLRICRLHLRGNCQFGIDAGGGRPGGQIDLPPANRASRSLVKFVFGEEDEHEEALYGTANHRVSEGSRGR